MPEYEVKRKGSQVTIKPARDVVAATVPGLRQKIKELVDDGVTAVKIDMSRAAVVDSMGIGLLIAAYNTLQKVGGTLEVVKVSPDLLGLFQTMRIDQHFSISGA